MTAKIYRTPLENATDTTIETSNDMICGWEGASKLIYCYKNDKDLIEWMSLLSDEFIERSVDAGSFSELDDHLSQDYLQIGLYLEMMKKNDWSISVHEDKVIKNANQILVVALAGESINRQVLKQWGKGILPGSGKIIECSRNKKNKYDLASYSYQANPCVKFEEKKEQ